MYNSGTEYIRVAGVVRPEDISSSNTVSSTKVADAKISYTGTGDMNDSVTKGWLSRYFAYVSPFLENEKNNYFNIINYSFLGLELKS